MSKSLNSIAESNEYNEIKVEALLASIGEGLIVTDDNGRITRVNKTALDIFGYSKDDLIDQRYTDKIVAVHEDGKPLNVIDRPMGKAILTGEVVSTRTFYKNNLGIAIPVHVTISPLLLRGKPIGTVQLFRDISDELKMDKLKSDFISLASHQLRTPLSSIYIYAGMLIDGMGGELNDVQQSYINTIITSASRMNQLIDTLLSVTHIEAGGISVQPVLTDIPELINQVGEELKPLAIEKNIEICTEIIPEVQNVKTDPFLLKEVLVNLLTNAIKYSPEGSEIEFNIQKDSNNIIFTVLDHGYGIPKNLHSRVFTKFFRADNILIQDVSGTGLGLYMTKIIADHLDGDVKFESSTSRGSVFNFYLPTTGSVPKDGKFNSQKKSE